MELQHYTTNDKDEIVSAGLVGLVTVTVSLMLLVTDVPMLFDVAWSTVRPWRMKQRQGGGGQGQRRRRPQTGRTVQPGVRNKEAEDRLRLLQTAGERNVTSRHDGQYLASFYTHQLLQQFSSGTGTV